MNFKQLAQTIFTAATLLIAQPIKAETLYFHNDHLGTPQALTDDSGTVVWQGNYSPFGEVTETTDTVEQNIRFPGQYFEQETGLHYNYFRDYDPGTGRYIESDPIGLDGGINTFGYVGGQPVSRIDPTGENALAGGGATVVGFCVLNPGACATATFAICQISGNCSVPADGSSSDQSSSSDYGSCDASTENTDDECLEITQLIAALAGEVSFRYEDLLIDRHGLYGSPSSDFGSWGGHISKYYETQHELQLQIARARSKGCPVDPSALAWANEPPPTRPYSG